MHTSELPFNYSETFTKENAPKLNLEWLKKWWKSTHILYLPLPVRHIRVCIQVG